MHQDRLKTGPVSPEFIEGFEGIDWSGIGAVRMAGRTVKKPGIQIISDIEPFISPCDGKVVSGRRQRREHNKRLGVVDIGDDRGQCNDRPVLDRAGPDIKAAIDSLS